MINDLLRLSLCILTIGIPQYIQALHVILQLYQFVLTLLSIHDQFGENRLDYAIYKHLPLLFY